MATAYRQKIATIIDALRKQKTVEDFDLTEEQKATLIIDGIEIFMYCLVDIAASLRKIANPPQVYTSTGIPENDRGY